MFLLGALTVLGGDSLTDFALALLNGLVVGTASSVFVASPLAVLLERRWPAASLVEGHGGAGGRPGGRPARAGAVAPVKPDRWSVVDPYADIPTGRSGRV
jgi:SecD/SecF fusion protein